MSHTEITTQCTLTIYQHKVYFQYRTTTINPSDWTISETYATEKTAVSVDIVRCVTL